MNLQNVYTISDSINITSYLPQYQQSVEKFIINVLKEFDFDYKVELDYDLKNPSKYYEAFFIIIEKNNVLGTVGLKKIDKETIELKRLYLDPSLRGRGLGKELLKKAITFSKENGYKRITLDTWERFETAIMLYKNNGFSVVKSDNSQLFMQKTL